MTRKHAIILAESLAIVRPETYDPEVDSDWRNCVEAVARACYKGNPSFNYEKFVRRCES